MSVLFGNGDGTFPASVNYAVGSLPKSVAVADVNGDGKLDLVTANEQSNSVSVLLGNGDGTFQAAVNYAVGSCPKSVAVADVNGDGKLDLVTANEQSNSVSVLLGNGDGTFQAAVNYAVGSCPSSVAVADVNGDGKPDLVAANYHSANVSVLLGNGDGTFQEQQTFATGYQPDSVAVADINGDGKPDLIVCNNSLPQVSVLQGNGDGTFQNQTTSYSGDLAATSVAVADLNGDGRPDIVTAGPYFVGPTNRVSVLLTTSNANFTGQVYTIDQAPPAVQAITPITPVNHAGVVTSGSSVSYLVAFSEPVTGVDGTDFVPVETGTLAATSVQATADPDYPNSWIVTIGGITGDGTLGLTAAANNHITDIAGNALASPFTPAVPQSMPPIVLGQGQSLIAAADINGDGKDDLIIANSYTNSMSVMLGDGDGTFQNAQPFAVGVAPFNGVVADLNGDGKPDLVLVNTGTDTVSVRLSNGDGTFGAPQAYEIDPYGGASRPWR